MYFSQYFKKIGEFISFTKIFFIIFFFPRQNWTTSSPTITVGYFLVPCYCWCLENPNFKKYHLCIFFQIKVNDKLEIILYFKKSQNKIKG